MRIHGELLIVCAETVRTDIPTSARTTPRAILRHRIHTSPVVDRRPYRRGADQMRSGRDAAIIADAVGPGGPALGTQLAELATTAPGDEAGTLVISGLSMRSD